MSTPSPPGPDAVRRAFGWAFVMNWGQRGVAMVTTFVLAAILGPHDFGVVAIALIYIQFVQLFLEAGLATAIVQRARLESQHINAAFWMNVAFALVLMGFSIGLAGWWADLNGSPELEPVIIALSGLLLIDAVAVVPAALLQRRLAFKALALRVNVGAFSGAVTGISLAVAGAGVWSLVAQSLVTELVSLVLLWAIGGWRPNLAFSIAHARELLGFSTSVFVANVGGFVNRRADALVLGLFFGPTAVGLYRLADRFVEIALDLTLRPIGNVSLPLFSRLQSDREGLRDAVASCLRTTALVAVPPLLVLAACADQVVGVLGSDWAIAGDVLPLLAVVGIAKAFLFFTGPLLFAVGRAGSRALMLWGLAAASAAVAVATGLALQDSDVRDQVMGMAWTRVVLFALVFVPINWFIVSRVAHVRFGSIARSLVPPFLAGGAAIIAVSVLEAVGLFDGLGSLLAAVVAGVLAAGIAIAVVVGLEPSARRGLASVAHGIRRRRRPTDEPSAGDSGRALPGDL